MANANDTAPATASASDPYSLAPPADANGTHRFAEVGLSPAGVVRCFGEGGTGDGYKVTRQWVFRKGGLVFTLYDWKATALYDRALRSPEGLWSSENPFHLHVGSKHPATRQDVAEFVDYLRRTTGRADADETTPARPRPRPPTPDEVRQLAVWLAGQGYEPDDALGTAERAYVAVWEDYRTGGPGYCGKILCVVWDGAPSFFDVFTWHEERMERNGRDYDEKECDRCGEKNASLCFNCWRDVRP